jgi:hypothetical protein
MPDYTAREKLKITAGAVASLVIAGWAVIPAIAFFLGAMQRKKPPQKPLNDTLRRQKRLCH